MTVETELLTIERKFWTGGADFYRKHVDEKCLTAFTDMAGVVSNEQVAKMVKSDEPRWKNISFQEKGFLQPAQDTAILTYQAEADRANGEHYKALVSSAYVKRGDEWKLAFHQQTPLH